MEFINTALDNAFAATLIFTALWLPVQFAAYVSRRRRTQTSDSTPKPIALLPTTEREPVEPVEPQPLATPAAIALESIELSDDRMMPAPETPAIAQPHGRHLDGQPDQKRYDFNLARSVERDEVSF
ncbi:hypothetical protein [Leptolyngbya sp. CCY15150]|uniref:hypothetical protein n=1 Tax=Leptolyngbya sp. CCY15150 TaxID=2767772 RepID=UPI00195003AE|nr:hypothetical protein [Leptolyngbya sp. CCY15150]